MNFFTVHARRLATGELELHGLGAPMIREELTRLRRAFEGRAGYALELEARLSEIAGEKLALERRVERIFAEEIDQAEEHHEPSAAIEHLEEMRALILNPPARVVAVEEIVPGSGSPMDLYNRADASCELCHGFGTTVRATGEGPLATLERLPCACLRSVEEVYGS